MTDIDLTDYVEIGAQAWWDSKETGFAWSDIEDQMFKHIARDAVLPVVAAVIAAYDKSHPNKMVQFMGEIG